MSTRHVATFGVRADSGTDSTISRPRDRDIPPEDQYGKGRGQSYRPGLVRDRTPPPRIDSYRARSPPRRPDYIDSYKSDSYRVPIRGRSRTPPRRDDYRRRSPTPPRFRDRELRGGDSYRVRPRSPPPRREDLPRDDLFRREPARDDRDFRDSRDFRDERDRGYASGPRSPPRYRDRSPMPLKRVRDPSPISSRGRRTPPLKRERLASPPRGRYDDYPPSRGVSPPRRRFTPDVRDRRPSPPRGVRDYRPRSRTPPPRNDRVEPRPGDDWRRPRSTIREPRSDHPSREQSAHASTATSRRSSPPVHPARSNLPQQPPLENRVSSTRPSPRTPYENREQQQELPRAPAPEPNRAPAPHQDTNKDVERPIPSKPEPTPAAREPPRSEDAPTVPRAPPTGPGGYRGPPATSSAPPTGPAATTRTPGGAPPSGPRGAPASRGDFAPRGRGGAGPDFTPRGRGGFGTPFRGGRGGAPPSGPSFTRSESFGQDSATSSPSFPAARGPPSGPRASIAQAPTAPAFRQSSISSNSTTTTYPRSQRFAPNGDPLPDHHHHHSPHPQPPTGPKAIRRLTEPMIPSLAPNNTGSGNHISHNGGYRPAHPQQHPALADIPKLVEGGVRTEIPLVDRSKLHKLEAEAEKLRRQVEEREARLRKSLREWDRLTREAETAALRTELAEEALKQLSGEPESQAAF